MSRTWRKKRIPLGQIITKAPDGPWWKQPNGPEEIARRQARAERRQARIGKRRNLLIEQDIAAQSTLHTRVRRGLVVEIPPEWRGQVTYKSRARARRSVAWRKRYYMRAKLKHAARQAFVDVEERAW